jgi:hypothetical protein
MGFLRSPQPGDKGILCVMSLYAFSPDTAPLWRNPGTTMATRERPFIPSRQILQSCHLERAGPFQSLVGTRSRQPGFDNQDVLNYWQNLAASLSTHNSSGTHLLRLVPSTMHPRLHRSIPRRQLLRHRRSLPVSSLSRQLPPRPHNLRRPRLPRRPIPPPHPLTNRLRNRRGANPRVRNSECGEPGEQS